MQKQQFSKHLKFLNFVWTENKVIHKTFVCQASRNTRLGSGKTPILLWKICVMCELTFISTLVSITQLHTIRLVKNCHFQPNSLPLKLLTKKHVNLSNFLDTPKLFFGAGSCPELMK
jgi:hypothetical protein